MDGIYDYLSLQIALLLDRPEFTLIYRGLVITPSTPHWRYGSATDSW